MSKAKYKAIGNSVTTSVDNKKRKEVLIQQKEIFSQQFDFSDLIGMDPETKTAIRSMPYEVRTTDGEVILKGTTTASGDTDRIFTSEKKDLVLFLGDGNWTLSLDAKHEL